MTSKIRFDSQAMEATNSLAVGEDHFVVRHQDALYAYENRCPHMGLSLEFSKNQFLTHDQAFIQCATHGALFDKQTGLCISGPCVGQSLKSVELEKEGSHDYIIKHK